MHFTPFTFALATGLLATANPYLLSAKTTIINADRTKPSIQEEIVIMENPLGPAYTNTLAEGSITLHYNFTLSATAQGRNPNPNLFWSFADREIHQWGMLGDAIPFSLRGAKLVYDNFEVGFGRLVVGTAGARLGFWLGIRMQRGGRFRMHLSTFLSVT